MFPQRYTPNRERIGQKWENESRRGRPDQTIPSLLEVQPHSNFSGRPMMQQGFEQQFTGHQSRFEQLSGQNIQMNRKIPVLMTPRDEQIQMREQQQLIHRQQQQEIPRRVGGQNIYTAFSPHRTFPVNHARFQTACSRSPNSPVNLHGRYQSRQDMFQASGKRYTSSPVNLQGRSPIRQARAQVVGNRSPHSPGNLLVLKSPIRHAMNEPISSEKSTKSRNNYQRDSFNSSPKTPLQFRNKHKSNRSDSQKSETPGFVRNKSEQTIRTSNESPKEGICKVKTIELSEKVDAQSDKQICKEPRSDATHADTVHVVVTVEENAPAPSKLGDDLYKEHKDKESIDFNKNSKCDGKDNNKPKVLSSPKSVCTVSIELETDKDPIEKLNTCATEIDSNCELKEGNEEVHTEALNTMKSKGLPLFKRDPLQTNREVKIDDKLGLVTHTEETVKVDIDHHKEERNEKTIVVEKLTTTTGMTSTDDIKIEEQHLTDISNLSTCICETSDQEFIIDDADVEMISREAAVSNNFCTSDDMFTEKDKETDKEKTKEITGIKETVNVSSSSIIGDCRIQNIAELPKDSDSRNIQIDFESAGIKCM